MTYHLHITDKLACLLACLLAHNDRRREQTHQRKNTAKVACLHLQLHDGPLGRSRLG
jgi:hypothetical protein